MFVGIHICKWKHCVFSSPKLSPNRWVIGILVRPPMIGFKFASYIGVFKSVGVNVLIWDPSMRIRAHLSIFLPFARIAFGLRVPAEEGMASRKRRSLAMKTYICWRMRPTLLRRKIGNSMEFLRKREKWNKMTDRIPKEAAFTNTEDCKNQSDTWAIC